ncbi:hypothetical protein D1007_08008 [Hordeum vulgare]|nr:hypothetical protein D1007_08008 [Hordeum vulgare]
MQRQRFGFDEGPARNPAEERRLKRPAATESEETPGGGDDEEDLPPGTRRRMNETQQTPRPSGSTAASSVRAVLQDFLEQQQRPDAQRQEAATRHAQERLAFEQQRKGKPKR